MMKKNLAFILALTMLVGSLFAVIPMAEGEDISTEVQEKYVPEIAYANVNYIASIDIMFAVPVPASLEEGEEVKVLVWGSREDSIAFNYNDRNKTVIEPEETKAIIGGKEYYVFKSATLDATQMVDVVCARPVVVKDGKAVTYGKVVDYSILEYVESAKGNIEGIEAVDNEDVIELLDDMLNFGGLAQRSTGKYYDIYANDELHKAYVNVVINGAEKGKFFAGFFKYGEGEKFTLNVPFFDGLQEGRVFDSEGQLVEDADVYTSGVQIATVDSDIEYTVEYENMAIRSFTADLLGTGFEVNNYNAGVIGGNLGYVVKASSGNITVNGWGFINFSGDASASNYYWHSIRTIANPSDPDDQVVQITATHNPTFYAKLTNTFGDAGLGDTIDPYFTIEMELGAYNLTNITSGWFIIRHRAADNLGASTSAADFRLLKIVNGVLYLVNSAGNTVHALCELPDDGLKKIAIVIDPVNGKAIAYVEDANGNMQYVCEDALNIPAKFYERQGKYQADPAGREDLAMYNNIYDFFMKADALEFTFHMAANGGKNEGKFTEYMANGTFTDMSLVKQTALDNYSFLIDDYYIRLGRVYE